MGLMQPGREFTARIAVLSILPEEFQAAQRALGCQVEAAGTGAYRRDGSEELVLKKAVDRSNTVAQRAVTALITDFRPQVVIVCGIAGGIAGRDNIGVGDVVVVTYLHYGELRKWTPGADRDRYVAYDQPSSMLRERHTEVVTNAGLWRGEVGVDAPEVDGVRVVPKVLHGPLVAGEKVLSDPSHPEQQRIIERHSDAIAVDMESFGAARAVHDLRTETDYNPLLLIIRGVSDLVHVLPPPDAVPRSPSEAGAMDEQRQDNVAQRAQFKQFASATAAAFTAATVDRILEFFVDPRQLSSEAVQ